MWTSWEWSETQFTIKYLDSAKTGSPEIKLDYIFWLKFAMFRLNIEILGKCILHRATHSCWKYRTMMIVHCSARGWLRAGFHYKSSRWHLCRFLTYSSSSLYPSAFAWVEKEAKLSMSRMRGDGGRSKQMVEKITKKMTSRTPMIITKITKMIPSQMVQSLKSFSHFEFAPTPIHLTVTPLKLRC